MRYQDYIAIDTETAAPDPKNAVKPWRPGTHMTHLSWWTVTHERGQGACLDADDPHTRKVCRSEKKKLFWNAKFDMAILRKAGVKVRGPIIDVMLLARLMDTAADNFTLKHWSRKHLGINYIEEIKLKQYCKTNKCSYGDAPARLLQPYAIRDARSTFELFVLLWKNASPSIKRLFKQEMKVLHTVMRMEHRGLALNIDEAAQTMQRIQPALKKVKDAICMEVRNTDLNPNSPNQIIPILYDGSTKVKYWTKSGKPSCDEVALLEHPNPLARQILEYRQLMKLRGTYLGGLIKETCDDGIIHPSFNQGGTRTGRFSSSNPNFQNLPRVADTELGRIRRLVRPRKGTRFLFIDYEQVELRLGAHFSQEPKMLEAINSGDDLHGITAVNILGAHPKAPDYGLLRTIGKGLNFAMFYGAGARTFRAKLLKDTRGKINVSEYEAQRWIDDFHAFYPKVQDLYDKVAEEVARTGGVTNPFGRFIAVDPRFSYKGVNYLVQSTPADLIKERMIKCDQFCKDKEAWLLMIIHDELVWELTPAAWNSGLHHHLVDLMQDLDTYDVPITVSCALGISWGQKKEVPR